MSINSIISYGSLADIQIYDFISPIAYAIKTFHLVAQILTK
jgi:hypothetical protein